MDASTLLPADAVLPDVLTRHAHQRPGAAAVVFDGYTYDYGKLSRRTERAAARLWHEWQVRPGDRVAWLGFNHVDELTLLFAVARLGAVLVPLNFRLAPAEWRAVLDDCTPVAVLHDADWAVAATALAAAAGRPAHGVDTLIATHADGAAPDHAAPDRPVLLVYTSGTSGRPKGAVHTQANLLANMQAAAAVQALAPADTVLTVLPLFHVGGLCIQTLPALLAGARVLLHARFDPAATLETLARERPTLTLQVPATMKALVEHPAWRDADLSSLRAVWAGSSVLPAPLVDAFQARGVPLCNVYGATETGPFSMALPPSQARSHAGSCGWPAPGVEVRLENVTGDVGEVCVRAPAVVRHYWPDLPAQDADGWFHSGDLARQAADGSYTIVGRAKDMIISGGENIYPAEIEHLLSEHPLVAECAVVGLPDARWGEVVAAVVVFKDKNGRYPSSDGDRSLSPWEQTLTRWLQDRIARYKLPSRWVAVEALPRTALGKVQKAALLRELVDGPAT
jgi:fatty-acyl-CoA synthase